MFNQLLINSIIVGSTYTLIALSFSLIYSTTKFFHFAHGAVYTSCPCVAYPFTTVRKKFDTTILIVEQKVREVLEIADRVYVLAMGKVVLEDSAASLKDGSRIKKAFLGG